MNKYLSVLLLLLLSASACMDLDDIEDPNTVYTLGFGIDEGVGEDFIIGEDTLIVIGAKFIIDDIELVAQGENEIFEPNNILVQISGFGIQDNFRVGSSEIFGGTYTGVKYNLTLGDTNTELIDPELVVRNSSGSIIDRFSYAISGIYNNEAFLFKSRSTAQINIGFEENVEMPEKFGSLQSNIIGDWKRWFVRDNEILDPNDSSNRDDIEENFERFFYARLFTIGQRN